jgi:drug/metabolite transporter (DMT)-like permease
MSKSAKSARLATALLISVTIVWGFTFVLNQRVVAELNPADLQTWRFGLATLAMVAIRPHWILTAPKEHFVHGFWLGLALSGGYLLQLFGLQRTSATASGFITGMFVVLTPLIAGFIFRQKIAGVAWIAVGITTVGLGLIAFNGTSVGLGELVTLAGAAMFALHIVGLERWSDPEYVYSLTTTQIGTVFLSSLAISLVQGGPEVPQTNWLWINIAFLAIVATCIGYFAQTWVQSQISATRTAIILTMEPVFSGIAGVTIGNDELTLRIIIGALLILLAMYVVELGPRQSAEGKHLHLES